jgi:ABC-type transport system involved in multi-copper enzyme maturation permease subunit
MNIFGPVLLYDLIRMARRGRYFLMRSLYAAVLLGMLYVTFESNIGVSRTSVHPNELGIFAARFCYSFMLLQFIAVLLMTPGYVGGAIAEEKVRQTLDYLLTTDLRNHEIIVGKLVSRLVNLLLFLLTGLPILSMIQLFGGVSPEMLWSGFAATLLTALSLTSLSIWLSVHARKPRDAIILTYLLVICYYGGWGIVLMAAEALGGSLPADSITVESAGVIQAIFESGHLIAAFISLDKQVGSSANVADVLAELLWRYAAFHGAVTLVCTSLAIWRIRRVYVRQRYEAPVKEDGGKRRRRLRPIGANAMLWKELRVESKFGLGAIGIISFILLALVSLGPGLMILGYYCVQCMLQEMPTLRELTESMNIYVRVAGTIFALLMALVIGLRAAGSIGSERERQTLEGLLASPLSINAIILAKWWGSIYSARWLFFLLCGIWLMGLISGGLNIVAFPLLLLLVAIYATFMASLGMFFAASSKTTLRAIMATIATALFVGGGHLFCCVLPLGLLMREFGPAGAWLAYFLAGITPPAVLGFAAFQGDELRHFSARDAQAIPIASIGIFLYVLAAVILRFWAVDRFRRSCGRVDGQLRDELFPRPRRRE